MIECSIKGCEAIISESLSLPDERKRWIILRACRCGAFDQREPKTCTCFTEGPIKISYWPNLDWWILGGVEEVTLCPDHRVLVMHEIVRQQSQDPSMHQVRPNPTNRH